MKAHVADARRLLHSFASGDISLDKTYPLSLPIAIVLRVPVHGGIHAVYIAGKNGDYQAS